MVGKQKLPVPHIYLYISLCKLKRKKNTVSKQGYPFLLQFWFSLLNFEQGMYFLFYLFNQKQNPPQELLLQPLSKWKKP